MGRGGQLWSVDKEMAQKKGGPQKRTLPWLPLKKVVNFHMFVSFLVVFSVFLLCFFCALRPSAHTLVLVIPESIDGFRLWVGKVSAQGRLQDVPQREVDRYHRLDYAR